MAHYAKVEDGIVRQVIVVSNDVLENIEFPDSEAIGQAFIASLGIDGEWIQTSYNSNFRGTYAGIGYTWDGTNFIAPEIPTPEIVEA